ncbi:MAG: hypothetical protein ABSF09_09215 [Candidatus Bathyarchaeia archaeon]|jgi:hypothetical protein
MTSLKKAWSDPVWSKVIAGIILSVIGAAAIYLLPPVQAVAFDFLKFLSDMYAFVSTNPFVLSTGILAFVVILLLIKLSRKSRLTSSHNMKTSTERPLGGVKWLSSLPDEEFHKYSFLLWFPLNHTLRTPKYYTGSEGLDHVPEVHELVNRNVLDIIIEDVIHFSVQIEPDVYKHLENELLGAWNSLPQKRKDELQQFRNTDFGLMMRGRSNVR